MTSKEIRAEIDKLVAQIGPIQAKVSELASQLMVVTKEEMRRKENITLYYANKGDET